MMLHSRKVLHAAAIVTCLSTAHAQLSPGDISGSMSMPMGGMPVAGGFGGLPQGGSPQAFPGGIPGQASGFNGLGAAAGIGGPPTQGVMPPAFSGGLPGSLNGPGMSGGASPQLPTLNLLGKSMQPGGGQTPQDIQRLQSQAVQDPKLDTMCEGKQRQSTNVGAECWSTIWTAGGCKAQNVPAYEQWHQTQTLEVLVADVVQWANLPDERHKTGCYGDGGPPVNEPAPLMPQGGMGPGGGMGLGSGMGLGGGGLGLGGTGLGGGMGPGGGLGLGGGLGMGAPPAQSQGPPLPPEVAQKIQSALQSPELPSLCPGVDPQATSVGEVCWQKIWTHVGCSQSTVPPYGEWHATQSMQVLVADAAQWASLPSEKHRTTCYGGQVAHPEL